MTAAEAQHGAPLVDANLLIWAHHAQFPQHQGARRWWAHLLSNSSMVGVPWASITAFLRISTHPRALERQVSVADAWAAVGGWLDRPNVWVPVPTDRHRQILGPLLTATGAYGKHIPDSALAALAIEWGLELLSADHDFARYPGLRWRNPLA